MNKKFEEGKQLAARVIKESLGIEVENDIDEKLFFEVLKALENVNYDMILGIAAGSIASNGRTTAMKTIEMIMSIKKEIEKSGN